jgi:hypothetical protein
MRGFTLCLLLLLLVGCLPAREFRQALPSEATFDLTEVAGEPNTYAFTLRLGGSPAVCVEGEDGSPVCPTFVLSGLELTSENPTCKAHATLAHAVRCVVREPIPVGYRVTVVSKVRPFGSVGFFLERDRAQPLFLVVD